MQLHIQPNNMKLGKIWNISLPAVETCGGMSAACAGEDGKCYVLKIYKRRPNVLQAHRNTYVDILNSLEYGEELELPSKVKDGDVFRIHVAGDFFAPTYVYAWIKLITNNPNIQFFAYTRSWRMHDMENSLKELASLPNMELLLSVDRDTGYPDKTVWPVFRTAYMMVDDGDIFQALKLVGHCGGMISLHAENGIVIEQLIREALDQGHTSPRYHSLTRPSL